MSDTPRTDAVYAGIPDVHLIGAPDYEFACKLERENSKLRAFAESFLNPEINGFCVPPSIRDDARIALGMDRVETPPASNPQPHPSPCSQP